ncbi:conserved phage C-terminal domain-containing protein [Leuconostoc gasicomitatum]|uniref:conserved phage C-terminal domain-containing protein n=1 Tax=Leuconostoc gasicomitatum TaxID=115778 RepID=UPI000BD8AC9E|nr:conserved phage C-terminal domain-containing protein [Leuconostoc gasicomitatum]MBZ5967249.1 conserved phage C-terminal domain-containing protein [Leuconostoc gasicomitatum]QFS15375.1 DNA replication protein [Leuconostoc gasicomitatum]SOB97743.1 putative DNA replication protein [Leuconostoc gasicomitatum]
MAQRRMFSKKVTDTDVFLDMPLSTQALYFHLNMHADDDGFIDNTKTIQRMIGSSDDDRKLLVAKQFLLPFENGVVVIKDWRVHNYIRKDTYNQTMYPNELEQLNINDSGQYERQDLLPYTERPRDVDETLTQVRLGKDRLGKDRKDILSGSDEPDSVPYKEIIDYLNEKANTKYRSSGAKTKTLIRARANDGFDLDDFKKVIDTKASQWLNDPKMKKFLRPETLFGTKFEGYLNEVGITQQTKKDYSQMTREQQLIEVMGKDGVRF